MDALGRAADLNRLDQFIERLAKLNPEMVMGVVNMYDLMDRYAASLGIDTDGLIKSPEEQQMEAEQAKAEQGEQMMMEGAAKSMPQALKSLTEMMGQGQNGG